MGGERIRGGQYMDEEDDAPVEITDDEITEIAKQVHKNFRKVKIDWRADYPHAKLTPEPGELDIFTDLMNLNPGEVYCPFRVN